MMMTMMMMMMMTMMMELKVTTYSTCIPSNAADRVVGHNTTCRHNCLARHVLISMRACKQIGTSQARRLVYAIQVGRKAT
jgi:hypothetical protein